MPFLAEFHGYGLIIGLAIVGCLVGAYFVARKRNLDGDIIYEIALICVPLAIVFARCYYVLFDVIAGNHWDMLKFLGFENGKFVGFAGLAIYGGLIGAVIGAVIIICWRKRKPFEKRISFMQLLDLGFTFIILGQAVGRWGNFINGEAYGNLVTNPSLQWFPYAIEKDGSWFQATFFYESIWNMIGFAGLMYLYIGKRKSYDGFIFACYCLWYGLGRSWIEGLRSDSLWLVPGKIRVSQLLSIILVIFAVILICWHIYRARKLNQKVFIYVDESKLNNNYYGYFRTKLAHPMIGSAISDKAEKVGNPIDFKAHEVQYNTELAKFRSKIEQTRTDKSVESDGFEDISPNAENHNGENLKEESSPNTADESVRIDNKKTLSEDDNEDHWDE